MNIRNFCIIAHIDHGKSTLADRLLEFTGTVSKRDMKEQLLDQMDLERERGITIKLQPVRMNYTPSREILNPKSEILNNFKTQNIKDQNDKLEIRNSKFEIEDSAYQLNLIDTPGHVDFTYEVSRSLAAVEGAVLLVDATQGIQAQTLTNLRLAQDLNLVIIPVINKIDLPSAEIEKVTEEMINVIGVKKEDIILVSGKEGTGVKELLDAIVEKIPAPEFKGQSVTRALIFDSVFNSYKGVIAYVRIKDGQIKKGDKIKIMATNKEIEALEVGYFKPQYVPAENLEEGEIGYIVTGLKSVRDAKVGDTITKSGTRNQEAGTKEELQPLPGFKHIKPFVFASIFMVDGEPSELRDALEKLQLNDASLAFEPENSPALGPGYRCGFLGLLHLDIIRERLEREYDLDLLVTTPGVSYEVLQKNSEVLCINSPSELPDPSIIEEIAEPYVSLEIITPSSYLGAVMELCNDARGIYKDMKYLEETTVVIAYEIPLAEIITDFYDNLKKSTSGYASYNYDFIGNKPGDLVKLDILIAGEIVDPLSVIIPRQKAGYIGRPVLENLRKVIPKQMFEISLQAAIGSKVMARESISALRKDVTAKLYGGDYSRKRKLLEKQKAGKKRMKKVGRVDIPQEAFFTMLKK
ncbi:MAG: GTP-binding protein LepA [candidate division CPR2 bacterium GW2011_GWC1_39_9]|uniref:Elongation factor 4 n=1 Tax=candidate division CPR2 bacterium GW2011_GWC2_39_10 TaxID=1618345 RepID=A0A0G0P5Z7_UNCC2|nr:MAG: GTP-binding protein LepA [candidate division CPR2 bacterium GW2011_GWC2_39_10]KKR35550.1 MAG: GTP-binding protein LepA [candidate division CPR2 bacterium GW2011_GWC1_39_9]